MAIRIQIPTPMRQHTEGKAVVEASGATVQGVFDDLSKSYPGLASRIFEVENGRLTVFPGNYEDYQWRKAGGAPQPEPERGEVATPATAAAP